MFRVKTKMTQTSTTRNVWVATPYHKECLGSNALAYKKKTAIWFPKEDRDLNLQGNAKRLAHKQATTMTAAVTSWPTVV